MSQPNAVPDRTERFLAGLDTLVGSIASASVHPATANPVAAAVDGTYPDDHPVTLAGWPPPPRAVRRPRPRW